MFFFFFLFDLSWWMEVAAGFFFCLLITVSMGAWHVEFHHIIDRRGLAGKRFNSLERY